MSHQQRLADAGIELPPGYPPAGLYVGSVRVGNQLHVGGHGPVHGDGSMITGKVGGDVDLASAQEAARLTGLQILRTVHDELGSLDAIDRVVKVFGMVNCAPGFNNTPAVIDGCSELFHQVFGDAGVHTRAAVGMAELPFDISVEIEALFLLKD
ncbi:MAG: RidA family protein [Actinomycetota bacterium]|jgi:enamine deaminase RidA (YjgF/YER057c/UK114 family)|nr:RidA family protein [Actinomycetota bacterium]